jgi:hypothetical protein
MRKYNVVQKNAKYHVVEEKTKHIMKIFDKKADANKLCFVLNSTSKGFNGESPRFFALGIK